MATTKTKEKTSNQQAGDPRDTPQEQPRGRGVVPITQARLPYVSLYNDVYEVDERKWRILIDQTFPGAQTAEAVLLALDYCKNRNLDILKKPVHIVPVWSRAMNALVETIWPGITEIRITAMRTKDYAGKDEAKFGPTASKHFTHSYGGKSESLDLDIPEWCQLTVYRLVQGVRCAFVGPKVYWIEAYATKDRWSEIPNEMWAGRPSGQLEKCAEAASLRAAFPEELGSEYAAEEMASRIIEGHVNGIVIERGTDAAPTRPTREDFKPADAKAAEPKGQAEAAGGDAGYVEARIADMSKANEMAMLDQAYELAKAVLQKMSDRNQADTLGSKMNGTYAEREMHIKGGGKPAEKKEDAKPVAAGANEIIAKAKAEVKGSDEYSDWLRGHYDALMACQTIITLDGLEDQVSPDLKEDDRAPWKEACKIKGRELANRKR